MFSLLFLENSNVLKKFNDVITIWMQPSKVDDFDECVVVVDSELDEAVEKFLHTLLDKFIKSWYQTVSHEKEFVCSITREFVDATQILTLRFRRVSMTVI